MADRIVQPNNRIVAITVPPNNRIVAITVPPNNTLFGEIVPPYNSSTYFHTCLCARQL